MSMVLPGVVGFKLRGKLRDGVTATDLVLTVTQMLRKHGVVGKFVEFYGMLVHAELLISFCTVDRLFPPLEFATLTILFIVAILTKPILHAPEFPQLCFSP